VELGTLLAIPLRDGRWTASQIVGAGKKDFTVVDLNWIGEEPPGVSQLRKVGVLRVDHHNWAGAVQWQHVAGPPPPEFRVVGVLPPLMKGECSAYGSWLGLGLQIHLQARWDALPEKIRRAYKATPQGPGTEITLELGSTRTEVRAATSQISLEGEVRWDELNRLPHLTDLHFKGNDSKVLDFVRAHPLISTFSWRGHGRSAIDLRDTNLTEVRVFVEAPLRLMLSRDVSSLSVSGDASQLTVVQPGEGRALSLMVNGQSPLGVKGLRALHSLDVVNATSVDVAPIARVHPSLSRLKLHGQAVQVPDFGALGRLRELRVLELHGCYGIDAQQVPVAGEVWPQLQRIAVDGFHKVDAARWKKCFAGVAHVELRGGKTAAWLAANLGNPFGEWTERSPAIGRAATTAWRKARSAIGEGVDEKKGEKILETFVAVFNKLDSKHGLDTIDREEIGDAFFDLASSAGISAPAAEKWFDSWRDF
jgi:hypothetical protein